LGCKRYIGCIVQWAVLEQKSPTPARLIRRSAPLWQSALGTRDLQAQRLQCVDHGTVFHEAGDRGYSLAHFSRGRFHKASKLGQKIKHVGSPPPFNMPDARLPCYSIMVDMRARPTSPLYPAYRRVNFPKLGDWQLSARRWMFICDLAHRRTVTRAFAIDVVPVVQGRPSVSTHTTYKPITSATRIPAHKVRTDFSAVSQRGAGKFHPTGLCLLHAFHPQTAKLAQLLHDARRCFWL